MASSKALSLAAACTLPFFASLTDAATTARQGLWGLNVEHSILGKWKEYALHELTPDFARDLPSLPVAMAQPSALQPHFLMSSLDLVYPLTTEESLQFVVHNNRISESFNTLQGNDVFKYSQSPGYALDQLVVQSGISHAFGNHALLQVSAVLAAQQFRQFDHGSQYHINQYTTATPAIENPSYGTGLKFGFQSQLLRNVTMSLSYQTRIDMDAIESYRGLFNEAADFDIPANAQVQLSLDLTARQKLSLEAQRILYSEITAFNSFLLPDRFTSLLGDGGSPEFRWDNLTVYNVSWEIEPQKDWSVKATYGTGNQPMPTSPLLYQALAPDFADHNVTLSLSHTTRTLGTWSLAARYAPPDPLYSAYYLNNGSQDMLAAEATWSLEF